MAAASSKARARKAERKVFRKVMVSGPVSII
jgi:hypothetical protein